MRGRFAPDGRYALFCGSDCRAIPTTNGATVRTSSGVWVLDPDRGTGSAVTVPDVQMFGGNPAFMWVADSSGFLAQSGSTWGVTLVDDGSFVPREPGLTTRWLQPSIPGLEDPTARTQQAYGTGFVVDPWYTGELEPAVPVHAALSFDGSSIWHLFDEPGASRAVLAHLTGPGVVGSVRSFVLPAGPALGFWLSPDDTHVVLYFGSSDSTGSVLAPVGQADATATGSVIDGNVADWVPAAAEAWPGR
jgi:hypothetical protein